MKERTRSHWRTSPFNSITGRMVIELVYNAVMWLNGFLPTGGISKSYIPRTTMTGKYLDFNKQFKVLFGAYVEYHKDDNTTNIMAERTRTGICLVPTANFQGRYNFCLRKGKRIKRKQSKELPMTKSVIKW